MEYVRLSAGLPPSSRLGFGCGSVMGRIGRAASLRAIRAALDSGITHFDVARLYGYGEAEALLGEALRGRRDRVVIASKFGLAPPRASRALRGLKPLAQKIVVAVPALRPLVRSAVGGAERGSDRFSAAAAKASLEASLTALGTDYLDILFLHEGGAADLGDELLEFLDRQVAAGTIRTYGAASGIDAVVELMRAHGERLVYQFGNSVALPNARRLPPAERTYIGHSPFAGVDKVIAWLTMRAAPPRLPSGQEVQPADLHRLMLGYALGDPSVGVVLCSMLDPAHLRANLAVVEQPSFTPQDIAAFATAVAETG
jgi:aryl-alcohol dehydrogenase-like predicted oxidoreductase